VFGAFSLANWESIQVQIWDRLFIETKVPALVILSFLLGFLPIWLLHRGTKWRLTRRISSLEQSIRIAAVAEPSAAVQKTEALDETRPERPDEP
jgi:putative membrane protein